MALPTVTAWLSWLELAAIDAPTASVIVAIIVAVSSLAVKLVPKTRPEATRDRALARLEEARAWDTLVENLRADNQELRTEVATLKAQRIASEAKQIKSEQEVEELRADYAALKRLLRNE